VGAQQHALVGLRCVSLRILGLTHEMILPVGCSLGRCLHSRTSGWGAAAWQIHGVSSSTDEWFETNNICCTRADPEQNSVRNPHFWSSETRDPSQATSLSKVGRPALRGGKQETAGPQGPCFGQSRGPIAASNGGCCMIADVWGFLVPPKPRQSPSSAIHETVCHAMQCRRLLWLSGLVGPEQR
jgi:hypothetical protein